MKKETSYVKIDARNRLTIPKKIAYTEDLSSIYKIYVKNGKIILEPIREIPEREIWLFDPKNKIVVDKLKKALKQKADREIDLDALEKE